MTNYPSISSLWDLSGKVTLVTGAGRGIGTGIAARFAEAGADTIIHYHSSEEGANHLAQRIKELGRHVIMIQADLTNQAEAQGLFQKAEAEFGRLDILINNAGTYPVCEFLNMTGEEWQKVIDENLTSTFFCAQLAAAQMKKQGEGGVIINISSIEAQNPTPLHAHYCAAKSAVDQFSRTLANELGSYNIRVNCVSPGLIWAEGIEQNWPEGVQRWQNRVPLKRLGTALDVANACLFLASPAASWITGVNLVVDGGMLCVQVY